MRIPFLLSLFAVTITSFALNASDSKFSTDASNQLGKPYKYYSSPLENLTVVPTKEGMQYTGVNYVQMEQMIRFLIAEAPDNLENFKKIKTVVIDYGVKDADPSSSAKLPSNPQDPIRNQWYIPLPQRYFVTLKFYDCSVKQIGTPSFQISSIVPVGNGLGTSEAFKLMLHEMFMLLYAHPEQRNIKLRLG